MKQILIFTAAMIVFAPCDAQTIFIKKGNIEFERKTNTYRLYFTNEDNSFLQSFKDQVSKFKTDYFSLVFDENKSLYKLEKENPEQANGFFESPANRNIVFKDMDRQVVTSQKQIFESQFLVADSIKNLEWKLTSETRTIAGFECHKALTKICDSVIVVAFYTTEILPASGPESFGGLPGMIMELAIPRLYTTWTATKLEQITDTDEQGITPPAKGKKASQKEMITKVTEGMKDRGGQYRDRAMWFVSL